MPRPDKQTRKAMLKAVQRREMAAAFERLPISNDEFQSLFDWISEKLPADGCDKTRKITEAYIRTRSLPAKELLDWLDDTSGFCDCEVLANSEQAWLECKDFDPDE